MSRRQEEDLTDFVVDLVEKRSRRCVCISTRRSQCTSVKQNVFLARAVRTGSIDLKKSGWRRRDHSLSLVRMNVCVLFDEVGLGDCTDSLVCFIMQHSM